MPPASDETLSAHTAAAAAANRLLLLGLAPKSEQGSKASKPPNMAHLILVESSQITLRCHKQHSINKGGLTGPGLRKQLQMAKRASDGCRTGLPRRVMETYFERSQLL